MERALEGAWVLQYLQYCVDRISTNQSIIKEIVMSVNVEEISSRNDPIATRGIPPQIRELSPDELKLIHGGGFVDGAAAFATAVGIGSSVWGGAVLGTLGVGAALAAAPVAAVTMVGLAGYAGYSIGSGIYNSFS